jgi:hypothetical protein
MTIGSAVGTIPFVVAEGGTGAATLTSGGVLIGAGTSAVSATLTPSGLTSLSAGTLASTTTTTVGNGLTVTTGGAAITGTIVGSSTVQGTSFIIGAAGPTITVGSGSPNGSITAPKGSFYLNTAGSGVADRAFINTNSATAWTAVTTAG